MSSSFFGITIYHVFHMPWFTIMVAFVHYVYNNHWEMRQKCAQSWLLFWAHFCSNLQIQISTGLGCSKITPVAALGWKCQNGSFLGWTIFIEKFHWKCSLNFHWKCQNGSSLGWKDVKSFFSAAKCVSLVLYLLLNL